MPGVCQAVLPPPFPGPLSDAITASACSMRNGMEPGKIKSLAHVPCPMANEQGEELKSP